MFLLTAAFIFSLYSTSFSNIIQIPELETLQGKDLTLRCDHPSFTGAYPILWYRVIPGNGPVFLISGYQNSTLVDTKFTITFGDERKYSFLRLQSVKPEESAVYYCAHSRDNNVKLTFGSGTKVTVTPKTDRTSPSVYQLTSYNPKESLPNTVCLLTDFPFSNDTLKVDEQPIDLNNKAALDKSSSDVWRYSAVIWDQNKNLNCAVKYNDGETILPDTIIDETTDTCSSLSVTERFHTNPSMNTLSTSVLGLRMLTAKAIVYNLIITLRLWSS